MKMKFNLFLLICVAFFSGTASGSEVVYNLDPYTFKVPKNNIPNLSSWVSLKSVVGLDEDVNSFSFEFSDAGAQLNSVEKILGAVYKITLEEYKNYFDSQRFSDLWYGENGYENKEVVFDEASGYYFIYESKSNKSRFYVFSKVPDLTLPAKKDDFFIAICSGIVKLKRITCTSQFLYADDLLVDFSIPVQDLEDYSKSVDFIKNTLSKWQD